MFAFIVKLIAVIFCILILMLLTMLLAAGIVALVHLFGGVDIEKGDNNNNLNS